MANNKSATLQAASLNLWLNGIDVTGLASNAVSSPLTNLYVALHTANPTNSGTQASNEISYTGYARVAVARNSVSPAWTISGSDPAMANPNAQIAFAKSAGGTGGTATYFSIGELASGAGTILYSGPISPSGIVIVSGVTPILGTATAITEN